LLVGCQGVASAPEAPPLVEDDADGLTRVAFAIIDVDPMAPPEQMLRVRTAEGGAPAPKAIGSVLGEVALSGPGTWHPATEKLTARVRVTNQSSHLLNEPKMVLDWLSREGVSAEIVHEGDGGTGSAWAFADIDRAGGANDGSARQRIRFHSPGGKAFSFRVQVTADVDPRRGIDPDDDDDGFNEEQDEPAGMTATTTTAPCIRGAAAANASTPATRAARANAARTRATATAPARPAATAITRARGRAAIPTSSASTRAAI
jgi:hypothetical protein